MARENKSKRSPRKRDKNKEFKDILDPNVREAYDILQASTSGVSPEFYRKNATIIEDIRRVVSDKVSSTHLSESSKSGNKKNSDSEYINALANTMDLDRASDIEVDRKTKSANFASGIKEIADSQDISQIEELVNETRDNFALMPEYEKIAEIIPEIKKSIEIIRDDVMNRDELTNSCLSNFYTTSDGDVSDSAVEKRILEMLKEYKFEQRLDKWITTALTVGVKPFSVLPQEDVIESLNEYIREVNGVESFDEVGFRRHISNESSFLIKSPLQLTRDVDSKVKSGELSLESDPYLINKARSGISDFTKDILTSELIEDYFGLVVDNLDSTYKSVVESDVFKHKDYAKTYESLIDGIETANESGNMAESIKNELSLLVSKIDKCIEVVDPRKVPAYQISKEVSTDILGLNEMGSSVDVSPEDFYGKMNKGGYGNKNKSKKSITINGQTIDVNVGEIDAKKHLASLSHKRGILTEYEPEHVIPISSGGVHVGYYVIEYVRLEDPTLRTRRRGNTVADIVKGIGIGDDSNAFGGQRQGVFADSGSMGVNRSLISHNALLDPNHNSQSTAVKRNELVKKIFINTIAKRLENTKITDNALFQSAVMNILRDDVLLKKGIRFSYIPASNMVYMARELNDGGYPVSLMDGTLFSCYAYLGSYISSLMIKVMKASYTEVLEVDMGKSHEVGLTIDTIKQASSTREITASNLFGGTSQIMNSVASVNKAVVPIYDGNKAWNLERVERVNDVDIDDEFTDNRLKSVIMRMGIPPALLDMMGEEEFAATTVQQNIQYRNKIIREQSMLAESVTKAIRLLVYYSNIDDDLRDIRGKKKSESDDSYVDIDNIEFKFNTPKNLTVNKLTEELSSVMDLVDSLVDMYLGEDDREGEEWITFKTIFKRKLVKRFSSSTDWTGIDDTYKEALKEFPSIHAEMSKFDLEVAPIGEEDDGY